MGTGSCSRDVIIRKARAVCDLYISYRTKNGRWTEHENLGKRVNTDAWESSPSLSPDKRTCIFPVTAPMDTGAGYLVSHRQSNGTWGEPVNLGPESQHGK